MFQRRSDLLAHGDGSGLLVCVQLHWLRGSGGGAAFTLDPTLAQDGVKHLKDTE